jgi:hypothetical protein
MGGAILAELLLSGRIEVEYDGRRKGKKKFARVVSDESLGDPLLDECLERIRDSARREQLQTWVSRFAHTKNLKDRVIRQLCHRGILQAAEDKVLFLFRRRIYPEIDPAPERAIIARLDKAIFGNGAVDPRTVVLVAITQSANLLKNAFDKKKFKQLKERKERIKQITSGDAAGEATREVVEAAQAAALVATVIASSVATTVAVTTATR